MFTGDLEYDNGGRKWTFGLARPPQVFEWIARGMPDWGRP